MKRLFKLFFIMMIFSQNPAAQASFWHKSVRFPSNRLSAQLPPLDRNSPELQALYETEIKKRFAGRGPVVFFTDTYHGKNGGVRDAIMQTERSLKEDFGIDSHVIYPGLVSPSKPWRMLYNFNPVYLTHAHIESMLADLNPSAVVISTEYFLGTSAAQYLRQRGIPFVTAYHTLLPEFAKARYGAFAPEFITSPYAVMFHRLSSGTLFPSDSAFENLHARGLPAHYKRDWSHGVDQKRFRPRSFAELSPQNQALYTRLKKHGCIATGIGRLDPEKDWERFLLAKTPCAKLVVGDGKLFEEYKRRGATGEFGYIEFTGYKEGDDLAEMYSLGEFFAFTSTKDTYAMVLAQAMASGMQIAAVPSGAAANLITPEVGVINEDLSLALRELQARNPTEADLQRNRQLVRQEAEKYTWKFSTMQLLSHLELLPNHIFAAEMNCANILAPHKIPIIH